MTDNLSKNHLFSPNPQMFFENALQITKSFLPRWKVTALVQFGKQYGDGASDTIATYSPAAFGTSVVNGLNQGVCTIKLPVGPLGAPTGYAHYCRAGFTGASYLSYEGLVTYNFNAKTNVSFRAEQFRNPNGFFLEPMAAGLDNYYGPFSGASGAPPCWGCIKGAFNDMAFGLNYNVTTHARIRPEIRYDWQSGNYQYNAFGQENPNGVTSSSQVLAAIDAVVYF